MLLQIMEKKIVNAVQLLSYKTNYNIFDMTCVAHSLQLSRIKEDSAFKILNLYWRIKYVKEFKMYTTYQFINIPFDR